jgi:hypothetical protein
MGKYLFNTLYKACNMRFMEQKLILQRRFLKFAIFFFLLILLGSRAHSQTTFYDNYAFRLPVTLNNASLGTSTDQTNFPVLLKLVNSAFISATCSDETGALTSTVSNFAVIDSAYSTSSELYYQIENYDATTGTIYVWVRIPTLHKTGSASGSDKLYFYFGSLSPSVSHTATWQKQTWSNVTTSSGISYSGVWHFNESPSGSAPQFSDATVNGNNLSIGSTGGVTQNTASQIGNGITLSTTSVYDVGAANLPNTNVSQSHSIWANYNSVATTANLIVVENSTNPASTGNGTQMGISTVSGTTQLQEWRWANRTTPLVKVSPPPSSGVWHQYVYTYDAAANKSYMYVDGALVGGPTSNSSNPPASGTTDIVSFGDYINNNIGGSGLHTNGGESYTGSMDEAHVIGVTLSADWIKAEYVDQSNPAAFTIAGTMQTNSARAAAVPGYLTYTWKGVSTDITSASNWNNTTSGATNELPASTNVNWVIPAGKTNYPVLTTSTGVYGLTIASGASVNLNGQTLSVGCNIYNSSGGQILYGSNTASQITWNGAIASQNYYGTNTSQTAQVGSMVVNNSAAGTVTINGGPVDVFNLLTLTSGNLVVGASPAALTLKSTSTLTATVTAIPSTYSISGNVSAERYISGGSNAYRGYRFLSSPIYTASSGSNHYFDMSYLPLYAPITGTNGTAGGLTKTGTPSVYLYRDNMAFSNATFNTFNFRGVNAINNSPLYSIGVDFDGNFNLHVGTGFLFFYRGNLTNIATKYITTTSAESNIFVSTGTLNQQAVTVVNWYTQLPVLQYSTVAGNAYSKGYNLVGNPYASSIDWNTYSTTNPAAGIYAPNVLNTIYIYNEVSKAYATYSGGIGVNGGSNIIPSGQGFFVKADTTNASLTFNEAAKTNAQLTGPTQSTGTTLLMGTAPPPATVQQYLRLELARDTINKEESVIVFNNSAKNEYVSNEDSPYFTGSGTVSLSTMSADNVTLAINRVPLPKQSQTIRLNVNATSDGIYKLSVTELKAIPDLYEVWLMDSYKKDSLDLRHNSTYNFNLTRSDTSSYGSNRFSLVIRQNPALGLHLLDFTAVRALGGVQVNWQTENEQNYTNFTVERSTDKGTTFNAIGGFLSDAQGIYGFLDQNPLVAAGATDEYRLKLVDLNGAITYSKIVSLGYSTLTSALAANNIIIYPNPASGIIHINVSDQVAGGLTTRLTLNGAQHTSAATPSYTIRIVNNVGAVVKTATSAQPTWQNDITNLPPGAYFVQVTNNTDNSLVGKGEFIKL